MQPVYHFTDSARLPWIFDTQELHGTVVKTPGFPPQDFLWATLDENGAATASCQAYASEDAHRAYDGGHIHLVRFTLAQADFTRWPEVVKSVPGWTDEVIARLEATAHRVGDDPTKWLYRAPPLPAKNWIAIEYRSYLSSQWRALPSDKPILRHVGIRGIVLGGMKVLSQQVVHRNKPTSYRVEVIDLMEEAIAA